MTYGVQAQTQTQIDVRLTVQVRILLPPLDYQGGIAQLAEAGPSDSGYHSKFSIRADRQIEVQESSRSIWVQFPSPTLRLNFVGVVQRQNGASDNLNTWIKRIPL